MAFIRVSKGEFGTNLSRFIGIAAEGDYCQITISDADYEWTSEDMEFWKLHCPPDDTRAELLRLLSEPDP